MRRKAAVALIVALFAALALAAAGCGEDEEAPGEEAQGISFDLTVGNLVPFTGDLSSFGEPIDQAARIGAQVANEAAEEAELDANLEIVASEDTQTDATAAVEAATKLVQTDNVDVVMGALASTNTIPVAESVTVPNGVLQISPASTSPAISDLNDSALVWRTPPSDSIPAGAWSAALHERS